MYSHPDAGPYYAQLNRALHESRVADLREAYAARREVLTDADREYLKEQYGIDRPAGDDSFFPTVPQLADLIAQHQIHVAPYGAIVYARIGEREVGVKYSAVGGDKAEAVRLAVREVLRLVGVMS